jgi:hypothetical protein
MDQSIINQFVVTLYGCRTWSLSLLRKHELHVSEDRIVRKHVRSFILP